jgi:hypothetical protein
MLAPSMTAANPADRGEADSGKIDSGETDPGEGSSDSGRGGIDGIRWLADATKGGDGGGLALRVARVGIRPESGASS